VLFKSATLFGEIAKDMQASKTNDEWPWEITDTLSSYLQSKPGSAWYVRVEVVPASATDYPRMIAFCGGEAKSWRIHPDDVAMAPAVIAQVIADHREYQAQPS
jgi:hypothetical protein